MSPQRLLTHRVQRGIGPSERLGPLPPKPKNAESEVGPSLRPAPRSELHDSLDTDAQGLELYSDDVFWHLFAEDFHQQSYNKILWERESVKTHTLASVKGSEGTNWL